MSSQANSEKNNSQGQEEGAEDEEEYVVEAIRKWRYDLEEKRREYLVKWAGYKESENTWEPEEYLHCPAILEEFKKSLSKEESKRLHGENPDDLNGFQRHADFRACVGSDGPHESDDEDSDKKDKQKFYCQILFQDNDLLEDIGIKEFAKAKPKQALKFIEQRLFRKSY